MTRRKFAKAVSIGAASRMLAPALHAQTKGQARASVKALVFDTFGTVVDWRGSIIAEGLAWSAAIGDARDSTIDWARFADRWRDGYAPAMERVRTGDLPWTKLDDLHRMLLNNLMPEFGMNGLSEAEIDHWNKVWHRLKPWPDAGAGLTRLKKKYTIAIVTHNLQQAKRVADHTAFLYVDRSQGGRTGYLVEHGPTRELFENPREGHTREYIAGAFS